jgi:hypothetical protein
MIILYLIVYNELPTPGEDRRTFPAAPHTLQPQPA